MKRSGRAIVITILVAVSYGERAHCQPLLSSYGIELDDRLSLIHSSRDAFKIVDGSKEVLMIDPVWDDMKLDAYCRLSKALLIRAHKLDEGKRPSDAPESYFVIDASDTKTTAVCSGLLSEEEFRDRLDSLAVDSSDIAWVVPVHPHPVRRAIMATFLIGMLLAGLSGLVLPIPFALVLAHYIALKKRLVRLTALREMRHDSIPK